MAPIHKEFTEMKFREWINIEESRLKGFKRQFLQTHSHIPKYVADQFYTNKLRPELSKSIRHHKVLAPTVIQSKPTDPLGPTIDHISINEPAGPSPNDLLNKDFLKDIQWEKKPRVIKIGPLDFDESTIGLFLRWKFGFDPKDDKVRDDSNRFDVQRQQLVNRIKEDNEPIVIVKEGNKYRLLEGYHRTMTYLIWPHEDQPGAPPEQIQILQKGESPSLLDFSKWSRVPIKAYIGTKVALAA
jgi:hypothetical protein